MCILSTKSRVFVLRVAFFWQLATVCPRFCARLGLLGASGHKMPLFCSPLCVFLAVGHDLPLYLCPTWPFWCVWPQNDPYFVPLSAFFWLSATNSPCFVPDPGPSGEICHKNANLCQDMRRHQQFVRKCGRLRILPRGLSHNERIKKLRHATREVATRKLRDVRILDSELACEMSFPAEINISCN